MNWKEVTVRIKNEASEAASNIMIEMGSEGVVVDSESEYSELTAYYYDDKSFPDLLKIFEERIRNLSEFDLDVGKIKIKVGNTRHEDWATSWHEYFKPIEVANRFIISPSWEDVDDENKRVIKIDPGMAFGIGGHETTQMCIELLVKYIDGNFQLINMLDIGAGTGILSIVGAYLGIDDITGIDIDPAAVDAARENVKINQVDDNVKIVQGDMTIDIDGKYSIITANLLPNLIMRLLPAVVLLMDNETKLILSGIVREKRNVIVDELAKHGLNLIEEKSLNEWLSLVVSKE
ncbi:MAG: 50S ribosomal protein L11 methyltransferase [Bacillota bacterium]